MFGRVRSGIVFPFVRTDAGPIQNGNAQFCSLLNLHAHTTADHIAIDNQAGAQLQELGIKLQCQCALFSHSVIK